MSCYLLYVGDVVSARSSVPSLAMCRTFIYGIRVRDLSVVGVQGNITGGTKKTKDCTTLKR